MRTRKSLHQVFDLGSIEQSKLGSNGPSSQQPVPSLDERANIYLRAVYGSQDLAGEEFARARLRILDAMAEQIASEVPARVLVSNKPVPARPHSAERWGAKAIAACASVALIVAAGLFSNLWLPEKWYATDLHAALEPQDINTNLGLSIRLSPGAVAALKKAIPPSASDTALSYAEGGHPVAQLKLSDLIAKLGDMGAFEYY